MTYGYGYLYKTFISAYFLSVLFSIMMIETVDTWVGLIGAIVGVAESAVIIT